MKETIDLLGKILTNILTALYEPFGFSLLLSFLAMFFYLYAYSEYDSNIVTQKWNELLLKLASSYVKILKPDAKKKCIEILAALQDN